ncbi:ribonuclease HI [Trypanosoma cruzi]|nr:ribonuclease HI [Trypanosoma cruzi]
MPAGAVRTAVPAASPWRRAPAPRIAREEKSQQFSLMELLLAQRRQHQPAPSPAAYYWGTAQPHGAWGQVMLCRQRQHPQHVASEWRCGRESLPLSAGVAEERRRPHSGETSGAEHEVA